MLARTSRVLTQPRRGGINVAQGVSPGKSFAKTVEARRAGTSLTHTNGHSRVAISLPYKWAEMMINYI